MPSCQFSFLRVMCSLRIGSVEMSKDEQWQGWKGKAVAQVSMDERKGLLAICVAMFITATCILAFNSGDNQTIRGLVDRCFRLPAETSLGFLDDNAEQPELPSTIESWHNLQVQEGSNYTSTLFQQLRLNATSESSCYKKTTKSTLLEGLPEPVDGKVLFRTDTLYRFNLAAYDSKGHKRCAGGDYYEVDLHDKDYKQYQARLPTVDFGNGSYGLELDIPSRFAGEFVLKVHLLFSNWHGMDYTPSTWVKKRVVLVQELTVLVPEKYETVYSGGGDLVNAGSKNIIQLQHPPTNLSQCIQADFDRATWQGRWTRSWSNDACKADNEKRFRCLDEDHFDCEEPWCHGPVGRLESNGWQYSAHCSFKIFQAQEAWKCLDGRWFLMWGDSNFQDTIRNMLLFVLDWKLPRHSKLSDFELEREYEAGFVNPNQVDEVFRVSQIFNGAVKVGNNGEGLATLKAEEHQQVVLSHFNGTRWPDTIIMNSGLHDGEQFSTIEEYAASATFVTDWWTKLYKSIQPDRRPQMVWRTTVAPAGQSRSMQSNPNKMEMYNQVMVEMLVQARSELPVKIIDTFDLSFPFHYNNDFSDGGHYGRAPGTKFKPWHGQPHWYFVDLMLDHIILNAVCPSA